MTHPPQLILGVDTHKDVHVAVLLDRLGRYLAATSVGTTDAANSELVAWTRRYGQVTTAGVEGTGSYGYRLAQHLSDHGINEVAQSVAPQSRIVYVDNDPLVLVHARPLLTSSPEGATDYIEADLRDPGKILDGAAATLDFTQPVALMLLGIVNFIVDLTQAHQIVDRLLGALASGSYLAMTHPTTEVHGDEVTEAMRQWNASGAAPICARSRQELARFFDGLELLEPGVVSSSQWRPDPGGPEPVEVAEYCAVGRKP